MLICLNWRRRSKVSEAKISFTSDRFVSHHSLIPILILSFSHHCLILSFPSTYLFVWQNVFFGRKARVLDTDDIGVCHCFNIEGVLSCEENCINRLVFYECDPRMCPCGSLCRNQRFQRAEYAKVWPFRTALKGWGLKAMEDILFLYI